MDYSRKPEDYFSHQRVELLEFLPEQYNTVLDVGCGEGSFLKLLQGKNRELWGIELVEKQAKKAKETFKNIFSSSKSMINSAIKKKEPTFWVIR